MKPSPERYLPVPVRSKELVPVAPKHRAVARRSWWVAGIAARGGLWATLSAARRFGHGLILVLRAALSVALWAAGWDYRDEIAGAKALPNDTKSDGILRLAAIRKAKTDRTAAVKRRLWVAGILTVATLAVASPLAVLYLTKPLALAMAMLAVLAIGALAMHLADDPPDPDRPERQLVTPINGHPIPGHAITSAVISANVPGMAKALERHGQDSLRFIEHPARTGPGQRPGTTAKLATPPGILASAVVEMAGQVATGFPDLPAGCVILTREEAWSENHFAVFIADGPLAAADMASWELLAGQPWNSFGQLHMGTDGHGHKALVAMLENQLVTIARSQMGKTLWVMATTLAMGLDPTATVWAFSAKPGAELLGLRPWCHRHFVGDPSQATEVAREWLTAAVAEIRRRFRLIQDDVANGGDAYRMNAQLARRLDTGLLYIVLDEAGDITWDDELIDLASEVLRHGGGAGVGLHLTSQRAGDDAIPAVLRRDCKTKVCLKVDDAVATGQALGPGAVGRGHAPHLFRDDDKGKAAVITPSWEGVVQLVKLEKDDIDRLNERVIELRTKAGRLPKLDVEPQEDATPDLAAAILHLTRDRDSDRIYLADLVEPLQRTYPEHWGGITRSDIKGELIRIGVPFNENLAGRHADGRDRRGLGFVHPDLVETYRARYGPATAA